MQIVKEELVGINDDGSVSDTERLLRRLREVLYDVGRC